MTRPRHGFVAARRAPRVARRQALSATLPCMNPVHPKKLLLSKWTAVKPVGKDKHFLVAKVIAPDAPEGKLEWIELESVMSKKHRRIGWRELKDDAQWRQGWV
jgi:tryptophan-rich hypothetical protein